MLAFGLLSFGELVSKGYTDSLRQSIDLPSWAPIAPPVLFLWSAFGLFFFRRLSPKQTDFEHRASFTLSGWAIGAGMGLWGALYYLATSRPTWYLVGLVFFVVTLTLFPIPSPVP